MKRRRKWRERKRLGRFVGGREGGGDTDRGNGADKWPPKFGINQQLICCPVKANTT